MTNKALIPDATKAKLSIIMGRYLD